MLYEVITLLGIKNEDSLSEARKSVGRAIKYLEDIVTGYVDAPFSEYEQSLEAIAEISYEKRYALLRKIGFAIGEIEEGYGANSKWKWSFVELVITSYSIHYTKLYDVVRQFGPYLSWALEI